MPTQAIINHAAGLELCRNLKVERFPIVTKRKEPATWPWVQAFMAEASPHLGALACFMFLTGARISEALSLRWVDVSLVERRALIKQTKIGDERRAHMPPVLVAAIANIPSNREPGAKVFQYSSRDTAKPLWRAAVKRSRHQAAGLPCLPARLRNGHAARRDRSNHGGEAWGMERRETRLHDIRSRHERRNARRSDN